MLFPMLRLRIRAIATCLEEHMFLRQGGLVQCVCKLDAMLHALACAVKLGLLRLLLLLA